MDSLLEIVGTYGLWIYALLFAYCALKSGSLPLFAGYAAQADVLGLAPVAIATFAGGYLGDEARFAISRRYGMAWAARWPWLFRAMETGKALVAKYGLAYVFLYRYPKGMRTVGAFPMGLGDMPWSKFTLLNGMSAAVWTFILVGVGYAFGAQVERAVEAGWGLTSVLLLVVMVAAIGFAWWRMKRVASIA